MVKAAQFAIEAQQKAMTDAGQTGKLTLVKIVSVKKQVVAGMNFMLALKVVEGDKPCTAEANVWWQACARPLPTYFLEVHCGAKNGRKVRHG